MNRHKKMAEVSVYRAKFHSEIWQKIRENVTAKVAFYHYLVVMQYNFIMDANTELKPQDLLKEILKKKNKKKNRT